MRAVIYCRVSTKEQAQNLSLPTQLRACRDYCETRRLRSRRGIHGRRGISEDHRPAGIQEAPRILSSAQTRCAVVVFYNITRFSRSSHDFAIARTLLQRLGISIRSVNELLSDGPGWQLTGNILAAIGQFDNDEKARRTAAGMQQLWNSGVGHLGPQSET